MLPTFLKTVALYGDTTTRDYYDFGEKYLKQITYFVYFRIYVLLIALNYYNMHTGKDLNYYNMHTGKDLNYYNMHTGKALNYYNIHTSKAK